MSRRREAAELARVLQLSTQEARQAALKSPHTLSSPRTTGSYTDDSREMEIRAVGSALTEVNQAAEGGMIGGVDPKLVMGPPPSLGFGDIGSSQSGPSRSTASGSGSGSGERSTIEQSTSIVQTSNISAIQPFTPTEPRANTIIPDSSDIPPLPPRQPALPSSSSHIPSSLPDPAGISSTEKSISTGSTSTSRPLFSPTQGSRLAMVPPSTVPGAGDGSPRVNVRHQYSRQGGTDNAAAAGPSRTNLSSSPPEKPRPSPKKPARRSRPVLESSDFESESDEEEPEPVETSRSASKAGKPVVMLPTSRSAQVTPKPKDNEKTRAVAEGQDTSIRKSRKSSPDPLLISTKKIKSANTSRMPSLASVVVAETPSAAKSAKTSEDAPKSTKDKDKSEEKTKKRESGRVKENQAKKDAEQAKKDEEQAERRRKRAEMKEKVTKEEARKAAELGSGKEVEEARSELQKKRKEAEKRDTSRKDLRHHEEKTKEEEPIVILDDNDEGSEYGNDKPARKKKKVAPSKSKAKQTPQRSSTTKDDGSTRKHRPESSQVSLSASIVPDNTTDETAEIQVPIVSVDESYNHAVKPIPEPPVPTTEASIPSRADPPAREAAGNRTGGDAKSTPGLDREESELSTQSTSRKSASPVKRPAPKKAVLAQEKRGFVVDEDDDEDDVSESGDEEEGRQVSKKADMPAGGSSKGNATSPVEAKSKASPVKSAHSPAKDDTPARPPLTALPSRVTNALATSSPRHSPGPMSEKGTPLRPDGIKFKTERNDLASVLSKFPGSRFAGMSRRLKIAPLHSKIGPPKKELPPAPKKAEKRKKGEETDEDEDEDGEDEGEEGEDGLMRKRKKKERGLEWFMVED